MLYTIVAQFRRQHYVYQVDADSPTKAILNWADNLDTSGIHDFGHLSKEQLRDNLRRSGVNAVPGLLNVHSWHAAIGGFKSAVYLIGTESL
jgi:hypothetical protein